jgi:hypothetical protein
MIITGNDILNKVEDELVTLWGLTKVLKVASSQAEEKKGDFGLTSSLEILEERIADITRLVMDRKIKI